MGNMMIDHWILEYLTFKEIPCAAIELLTCESCNSELLTATCLYVHFRVHNGRQTLDTGHSTENFATQLVQIYYNPCDNQKQTGR